MSHTPFIPYRIDEVFALGRATRLMYADMPIENVASSESIILQFVDYDTIRRAGLCTVQAEETCQLFVSSAEPNLLIESRYPAVRSLIKLIVVATDHNREGESVSTDEIFWHEYFHINWSPELEPYDHTKHEYSTHGVLDRRDESNADLFAASVMIDTIAHDDSLYSLCRRNKVSIRLAKIAMEIERSNRLFTRVWRPRFEIERGREIDV